MKKDQKRGTCLLCVFLSLAVILLLLTSCGGRGSLKVKNADGTVTRISYFSSGGFRRSPVFRETSSRALTMSFNGTEWYGAKVITSEERSAFDEEEQISESTNIRVYPSDGATEFAYTYILDLNGTDAAYIRFDTNAEPGQGTYGNDFTTEIRYEVDGEETIPDVDGLSVPEEY